MDWFLNLSRGGKIAVIVSLTLVVTLCATIFGLYGFVNSTWNEGIGLEKQLTAQYLDNQNYLSAYVSGFYEQAGVLQVQGDVLDSILLDAVKGRYEDGGFAVGSPMFAAIVEAYPEAGVAELIANWGKLQDFISAGREGYRAQQSKLLDILRRYDTWRETGLVRRIVVRNLGFPSNNLEARVGEMVFTGEPARDKMYQIVLTSQALAAYESGTLDPLQIPTSAP